MKAIVNTETGLCVKSIHPLEYAETLDDVLILSDDVAEAVAPLLGETPPHEPQSPPQAPYPTQHPPR